MDSLMALTQSMAVLEKKVEEMAARIIINENRARLLEARLRPHTGGDIGHHAEQDVPTAFGRLSMFDESTIALKESTNMSL